MLKETIWKMNEVDEAVVQKIMSFEKMPYVIACLLANRGIDTKEVFEEYYHVSKDSFHDPFLMLDMDLGVKRILEARDKQESIVIYGDYDVDGVTSTSVLYMFLDEIGCRVDYYIPDRHEEGYGINVEALEQLKASGADLVISVDTGITAVKQVDRANEIKLDMIITDHHECQEEIPRAIAVINPKRADNQYPFKMLAGVGVAFKLIQGIARTIGVENKIYKYLDLVAVGTVADIVPLYGENRVITKLAFETMGHSWNEGLRALIKVADIEGKKMTAGRIGFGIGPRLNAAGRIKHAKEAVKLFISHDKELCMNIAEELDEVNKKRQELEKQIYKEAVDIIESTMKPEEKHIIVVSSKGWHHGVIGIVASKLVERYYRPVIILAIEEGVASGSARSVEGFSIFAALNANKEIFDKFGGHEMAAGMSFKAELISKLDEGLNAYAKEVMTQDTLVPKIKVDMNLSLEEVNISLIEEIQKMEPFGIGNREPTFKCSGAVKSIRKIGKELTHLRIELGEATAKQGVGFSMGEVADWLGVNQEATCICSLDINEWRNIRKPQIMLKDIRHKEAVYDALKEIIYAHKTIDYIDEHQSINKDECPTREDYTNFYRYLMKKDKVYEWHVYYTKLMELFAIKQARIIRKYFIMLEVFSELELLTYEIHDFYMSFELIKGKKVDLTDSKLYNEFL